MTNDHAFDGDTLVVKFQVADVNYWLSGESPALIPDDYFTNCQAMLDYQVKKIERHMERFEDDYIPFLFPWYGTVVIPSALGAEVVFQPGMDPAIRGAVIHGPEDVRRLALPDPNKDGLMPRVLETITSATWCFSIAPIRIPASRLRRAAPTWRACGIGEV